VIINRKSTKKPTFDNVNVCEECGEKNSVVETDNNTGGIMTEADTKCLVCGHIGHWFAGFFEADV